MVPGASALVGLSLLLLSGRAAAFDLAGPDPSLPPAGGATAAAPFHIRSFVLNPALLGFAGLKARGLRLSAGLTLDARRATTRRLVDATEDTAESPLEPRVLPHVAAVGSLGLLNLTVGAWYAEKSGAHVWFPGRNPADPELPSEWDRQRYGALSYDLRRHQYGMALAWRPLPWLGLGASVGAQWLSLSHRRVLATGTGGTEEEQRADLDARVALQAPFVPLGLFGVLVRPLRWLRLGLSFQWSGVARLEGTARLQPALQDSGSWTVVQAGEATSTLRLPLGWVLRAGLGLDLGRVSVDVAGSLTGRPSPRLLTANAPGMRVQPLSWQPDTVDVNGLALGIVLRRLRLALSATGRVALVRRQLFLSVGYGFTHGAADPRFRSAALVAPDRHLLALGVSFRRGGLRVDVAYVRAQAVVTSGSSRAVQSHVVDPTAAVSIASGRQSLSGDLASLTLTVDMDFGR